MKTSDFDNISMNGRMAYAILCIEKYLISEYPNEDWSELSRIMWGATSMYWDEWDDKFIEIIPQYLFEFKTYEEAAFEVITEEEYNSFVALLKDKSDIVNQLLMKLQELHEVYCYSSVPGSGKEASDIVLDVCSILEQAGIPLPDINIVSFSHFSEKDGWGNDFEGEPLSLVLSQH